MLTEAAHKSGRAKADFELREISREEYERVIGQWIGACRMRLLAIPTVLAREILGHHDVSRIEARLRKVVEEAVQELRPFDEQAFRSELIDYAQIEPNEPED